MKFWVPTALALAVAAVVAAPAVDAGSCGPKKGRHCLDSGTVVNFSAVPEISRQIVSQEPAAAKPDTQTLEAPPLTTYTGPTVGVSKRARAPTVGYYWSLD